MKRMFTVVHGTGLATDHNPRVCQIGVMDLKSARGVASMLKRDASPPNVLSNKAWRAYRQSIRVVRLVPVK